MPTPCITVIVPVYNTEKYINKCIDSILAQTFTDFELILIDDGSLDNSGKICDEYEKKDDRIRVFHQENHGVSAARNIGIDNARGEYITFIDSDDYVSNIALEILYNDIKTYSADISFACGTTSFSNVTEAIEKTKYTIWNDCDGLKKALKGSRYTNSVWSRLYKRDFVADTRFEEGRHIHEDGFFFFCCFLKRPTIILRNVRAYYYRNNSESASHSKFSDKFFDIIYFANRKKELVCELFPEFKEETNSILVRANLMMLQLLCRGDGTKYKKEIKQCIKVVKKLKKYFIPVCTADKKFFKIVKNNLYYIYRIYYKLKNKMK